MKRATVTGRRFGLFLFILFVTSVDSFSTQISSPESHLPNQSIELSKTILEGLRSSHPPADSPAKLDLETDFYDASTGLVSEGVWHNCLVGIAFLELGQLTEASRIAKSLWKYSWDGTSFRRRSWSGNWDHSSLMDSSGNSAPHQADYYRESAEHRCIQHGIALCFWSRLARSSNDNSLCLQEKKIAETFIHEFWNQDANKWTTVSKTQGCGSILRPSASANKQTLGVTEDKVYYRVVDQAIAVLACLEHMQLLKEKADDASFESMRDLVQQTCQKGILEDFGFQNLDRARTYINLDRNRNFWHEGYAMLALVQAREYIIWQDGSGDDLHGASQLEDLWQGLLDRYGDSSSTIWHWATAGKEPSTNVRYCGDNALAFCIRRQLGLPDEEGVGFWNFIKTLRKDNEKELSAVADAYPQVRLHPNTELAALVLWP